MSSTENQISSDFLCDLAGYLKFEDAYIQSLMGLFTNSYDFIDYMMEKIWNWSYIVIVITEVEFLFDLHSSFVEAWQLHTGAIQIYAKFDSELITRTMQN